MANEPQLLDEQALADIESRLKDWDSGSYHQASWNNIRALVQTVRALRVQVAQAEQAFELESAVKLSEVGHLNVLQIVKKMAALHEENTALRGWKQEALPLLTRYDNLAETFGGRLGSSKVANLEQGVAALREQLAEARQLAETRSDIIAAKAAHVDKLQAQLTGHSTSSLLRRLKDFLFENCNHSERDRNYDWCPSCVMAFMDVVAQPSDTELKERLAQVEKERSTAVQFLVKQGYERCAESEHGCDGWHERL